MDPVPPATCSTSLPSISRATTLGEHVVHDYAAISLSLKAHPIAFFRDGAGASRRVITSAEHWDEQLQGPARARGRAWCWCASGPAPPRA